MFRIDLLQPEERRVQDFVERFFDHHSTTAAGALLFDADRWDCVEVVALISAYGTDAGIATLAPTNELGSGSPHIIALWTDPEFRASQDYAQAAVQMLRSLVAESEARYSAIPTFALGTQEEQTVARLALEQGIKLNTINLHAEFLIDL